MPSSWSLEQPRYSCLRCGASICDTAVHDKYHEDQDAWIVEQAALADPAIRRVLDRERWPNRGKGWELAPGNAVMVDGMLFTLKTKPDERGRDQYVMVGDTELCFQDKTPWQIVVEHIRKERDK